MRYNEAWLVAHGNQVARTTVDYTGQTECAFVAGYVHKAMYGTRNSWLKSFSDILVLLGTWCGIWCQARKADNGLIYLPFKQGSRG